MAKDPYAPPASEEEQLHEVARLLGVALGRWHKLNRARCAKQRIQDEQSIPGESPTTCDTAIDADRASRPRRQG